MQFSADQVSWLLSKVRKASPLIHNITNYVVMEQTANALLAVGASPIMAHAIEEIEEIESLASALVLNIGTPSQDWIPSIHAAIKVANHRNIPVVFDPVGAGATNFRTEIARNLINNFKISVIRGNPSEIASLFSNEFTTRGVDSAYHASEIHEIAKALAKKYGTIISMSGESDFITDGDRILQVNNGHKMMTQLTGTGCTATAITGAMLTAGDDALHCAAAAMVLNGIAGEIARKNSQGLGSFRMHYLDTLTTMDEHLITKHFHCIRG
jgi:hydroxyethylthiazole kinase